MVYHMRSSFAVLLVLPPLIGSVEAKSAPQVVSEHIESKHFAHAADVLQSAIQQLLHPDLLNIDALANIQKRLVDLKSMILPNLIVKE